MSFTDLNSIRHTFTEEQIDGYMKFHQNIIVATLLSMIGIISYCIISS